MKKLLLLAVALLGTAYAQAQTITADNVEVLKGKSANIAVALGSSSDEVRDVQFSFVVPAGLNLGTPVIGDATTNAGSGEYAVALSDPTAVTGGNKYTVVVYSESGEFLNDGTILNIPVTVPSDYAGAYWDAADFDLDGIAYTVDDATETAVAADVYSVEIGLLADVNKSGDITAADAQSILAYTTGTVAAGFALIAANVNESADNAITAADAQAALALSTASSVKGEVDFDDFDVEFADDAEIWAD